MSYGVRFRITKPLHLHPEMMRTAMLAAGSETASLLEHDIGRVTPEGVGGARTGLKASIFSEVREHGTRITTITGTNKAYAMPVEFGRRPGQKPPPVNALLDWVGLRFGISDPKQQKVSRSGSRAGHRETRHAAYREQPARRADVASGYAARCRIFSGRSSATWVRSPGADE